MGHTLREHIALLTLQSHPKWFLWLSLHTRPSPVPSSSMQNLLTCSSHAIWVSPLDFLHSKSSLLQIQHRNQGKVLRSVPIYFSCNAACSAKAIGTKAASLPPPQYLVTTKHIWKTWYPFSDLLCYGRVEIHTNSVNWLTSTLSKNHQLTLHSTDIR